MILASGCWARMQGTSPLPLNVLNIFSLKMALKNHACIFSLVSLWGQDLRHRKLAFVGVQTLRVSVLHWLQFAAVGIASGPRPWTLIWLSVIWVSFKGEVMEKDEQILLFPRENIFDIWMTWNVKMLVEGWKGSCSLLALRMTGKNFKFSERLFQWAFPQEKRCEAHRHVWEVNCGQLYL